MRERITAIVRAVAERDQRTDARKREQNYEDAAYSILAAFSEDTESLRSALREIAGPGDRMVALTKEVGSGWEAAALIARAALQEMRDD